MTTEEKFWLDRFLQEIPLLYCDEEELDYVAIMSRFHYLLLKKEAGTYEEFVKYWATLIITAPDAFDEDRVEHNRSLVFSKVKDSAIKLNRPMCKIELPPGQQTLLEASNFQYKNWKPFFDETYTRTEMDDLAVYNWYTDPTNTLEARSYFGVYCMLLLRAYTREPSTTLETIERIPLHYGRSNSVHLYAPSWRISFSLSTATYLRDAFRSQIETYRKVLRYVLDWNEYHIDPKKMCDWNRRNFYALYIEPDLIYYGLSIMRFATHQLVDIENWLKFKSACEETGSEKLLLALKSIDTTTEHIDGLRRQDGNFLRQRPNLWNENCRFWPYSRLFSTRYFESVADENNLEFMAFCLGYKDLNRDLYSNSYKCYLENSIHDNDAMVAKDVIQSKAKEEFERGYDAGRAIYTSQNPPK